MLDAAKYLVETSDLFKNESIEVQNTWVDNISSSSANEDWSEFIQNTGTLSANLQTDEIVKNNKTQDCQNSISLCFSACV